MKRSNFIISLVLASVLVFAQAGIVFAAPAFDEMHPLIGRVLKITLESDPATGITTVRVKFKDQTGGTQEVRLSEEDAKELGLVTLNGDGNPVINRDALGLEIEIDAVMILPDEEQSHPVAAALATYFEDIDGLDYETIMSAHQDGNGFGVLAQALWMIRKLDGNSDDLVLLLEARRNGDFSDFQLEDGTTPASWNELRKAVANNLGTAMSHTDNENNGGNHGNQNNNGNNGNGNQGGNDNSNNGNGNGNGLSNGNGDGNGNGNSNRP